LLATNGYVQFKQSPVTPLQEVGAGLQRLSQPSEGWQPPAELTTKPGMHCEHLPLSVLQLPEVDEHFLSQATVPDGWQRPEGSTA